MKKRNTDKTEVLKRRFTIRKDTEPETVNPFGDFRSKYAHFSACKYLDSDRFAMYEAGFPDHARDFFSKAGADKYNKNNLL